MAGITTFEEALANFKSRLSPKESKDFSNLTTLKELEKTIDSIQSSQESKKEMMNLTRIRPFLEGMKQLGKVVDVFLNTSEILAYVWGPMKFLLLTASVWTDSFDALLGAYESIGNHLPLLKHYERLFRNDADVRKLLGLIYTEILKFHSTALRFFTRPGKYLFYFETVLHN
ncbi:hypothetical protein VMCG_09017 [Cytospora schulzeri]|uniref:DUF7708 domain-containing protein n=1 Tax=Cytospora schulzeri TaxID=448051 RepID=A0A423VPM0_9PEZI|nr:hypothetical protein VMCG_09017 [Valsa malicola]